MQTCDVAVIGAGIVGAACAYEFAACGLRVVVVEPSPVVAGASILGYGSLGILDEVPGQFELTRYGLSLWDGLAEWLPGDCEYRRCGRLWIAADAAQLEQVVRIGERFNRLGVEAELLDGRHLAEAEPALRPGLAGGLYVPADSSLQAGRAAEFLLQLARQKGAETLRKKALAIREHELTLAGDEILYAGNIVNAAGAEAAALTPQLPVEFSKGHVLVVETAARCARHQISAIATVREAAADATVRFEVRQKEAALEQASEIWLGSSYQRVSANPGAALKVEPRMVATLLRLAIEMAPSIGSAHPLRSWAGLRVHTSDGLPLIGRVAGKEGIFVAAAHEGYGATTALATAKLIADEVLGRSPEIDSTPYRADRFERK